MKRWIPATCVALLCGAAFGQTCDRSQSCGAQAGDTVSLVKSDNDCASACTRPTSNWLSVAFQRATKARQCSAQGDCPHATASVVAVSETRASSCCSQGQSTAAAIVAAAATSDKAWTHSFPFKAEDIASSELTRVKTASQTSTCSQGTTCSKSTAVLTKVAATFTDDKTCTLGGPTCTGVASPVAKDGPVTGKPIAWASLVSLQTADDKTAPCCVDGKGACCAQGQAKVSTVALVTDKAINKVCPMTGMPVSDAALVEYKGKTLGFCGAGCAANFNGATADEQEKIYNTILAAQPVTDVPVLGLGEVPLSQLKSDPYTLDTCAVSGGKLGLMGEPITKVINGREVKFCCGNCVPTYEADPAKFNTKIDAMLIKQQLPYYPAQTCAVRGTPLMVDGKDVGKNIIVNNRLVRVCCANCAAKLKADPTAFLAKLDQAVIAKQTKDYPLDTCIVRESSELGAMGEPVQLVSGNRLVKFCCGGCVKKFKADPAAYIAKLDKAWQTKHPEMFKVAKVEPASIKAIKIIPAGG